MADGSTELDWDVASYVAGWHKTSARPGEIGNIVLAGHSDILGEVFQHLGDLNIGDTITLYAGGRTFDYVVNDKFVVQETGATWEQRVDNGKWIGQFPDARLTHLYLLAPQQQHAPHLYHCQTGAGRVEARRSHQSREIPVTRNEIMRKNVVLLGFSILLLGFTVYLAQTSPWPDRLPRRGRLPHTVTVSADAPPGSAVPVPAAYQNVKVAALVGPQLISTAEDSAAPRFTARVTMNVRLGPGTGYRIVGQLPPGQSSEVTGVSPARDWLQFSYNGLTAWIFAGLVDITGMLGRVQVIDAASAAATSAALAPDRIVAPAIHLDTRVVPVGWRVVQTADGPTSEWIVASYAAGWHINSARPGEVGNTVISGHNNMEGEVFRYLVDLKPGDEVTLYSGEQAYRYVVTEKFILPDKYVSQQQREENARWIGSFPDERLTMVTCWPYTNNTHRVIVIARPGTHE